MFHDIFHFIYLFARKKKKQTNKEQFKYSTSFCSIFQTESLLLHSPLTLSFKKTFFPPITEKRQ